MRKTARQQQLDNLRRQHSGDPFFDKWESDFDKNFNRVAKFGVAAWLVGILLTLAFWGVVVWGIIELVQWVTAQ